MICVQTCRERDVQLLNFFSYLIFKLQLARYVGSSMQFCYVLALDNVVLYQVSLCIEAKLHVHVIRLA